MIRMKWGIKMSKQYNILLVCAGGMSSSLLVTNMQKSAKEQGIDAQIQAMAEVKAKKYIFEDTVDIILLGPQIRFEEASFKEKIQGMKTKLAIVDMLDYGIMDGKTVLKKAIQLIEN